ncbi:MAG: hypothetical protein QW314_05640 [Thermoproteota archaeon]|nr:hypothetical protein [Candidatus Brockarchaeota archaeon]
MEEVVVKKQERGLTLRILLAYIFSVFVIQPILMYYFLISNSFFWVSGWIPILLFSELANLMRAKLSNKELFILMIFQPVSLGYSLFFLSFPRNMYFAYSEPSRLLGVETYIPSWWIVSKSSLVTIYNSKFLFFNAAWVVPLSISLIFVALSVLSDIILGYLTYEVFAVVEKLEFPFARAQVALINSLSQREPEFIRILFISVLAGVVANIAIKFIPFVLSVLLLGGTLVYGIPVYLYVDFTPYLDQFLPGATLIIPTDPVNYIPGLLLPPKVAFIQFLASFALYFVGTFLITKYDLWPPESKWATGWGYWTLQYRSLIYFYVSLLIGLSLAAMIVPVLLNPTPLKRGFSALAKASSESKGLLSAKGLVLLYLFSSLGLVFLSWYLTNFSFPILALILLVIGGSFFATYIATASAGVTVFGTSVPYLRELVTYYSGYQGKDIWFVPLPASLSGSIIGTVAGVAPSFIGGSSVAQALLQADLVNVEHSEFFKSYGIFILLSLLSSFILVNLFWFISPMPSSAYPYTVTGWPVDAVSWARLLVWGWSGYIFRPTWIIGGFVGGAAIYIISSFLLKTPAVLIVSITGALLGIPFAFSQLVGSLIGSKVFAPAFKEKWQRYSYLVVSGYILGDALMEFIRILIICVIKSQWLLPF